MALTGCRKSTNDSARPHSLAAPGSSITRAPVAAASIFNFYINLPQTVSAIS